MACIAGAETTARRADLSISNGGIFSNAGRDVRLGGYGAGMGNSGIVLTTDTLRTTECTEERQKQID
jgi:hypothetical protein